MGIETFCRGLAMTHLKPGETPPPTNTEATPSTTQPKRGGWTRTRLIIPVVLIVVGLLVVWLVSNSFSQGHATSVHAAAGAENSGQPEWYKSAWTYVIICLGFGILLLLLAH